MDHLVFAGPDLDRAVDTIEARLGLRPAPGGRHPVFGTRNALLALGERTYLEVIGPDPEATPASGRLPFGIARLDAPRLVTWAVAASNLDRRRQIALAAGYDPGFVQAGSRNLPGGERLEWQLLVRRDFDQPEGGLVPFLIDWAKNPHPAEGAPPGCHLLELRGEHPAPEAARIKLRALGTDLSLRPGPRPALRATILGPAGEVTL